MKRTNGRFREIRKAAELVEVYIDETLSYYQVSGDST
jgi:hypothetical protein